jgi:hypothetical protein
MLLLKQYAFRFSERLVSDLTSNAIEQDCLSRDRQRQR